MGGERAAQAHSRTSGLPRLAGVRPNHQQPGHEGRTRLGGGSQSVVPELARLLSQLTGRDPHRRERSVQGTNLAGKTGGPAPPAHRHSQRGRRRTIHRRRNPHHPRPGHRPDAELPCILRTQIKGRHHTGFMKPGGTASSTSRNTRAEKSRCRWPSPSVSTRRTKSQLSTLFSDATQGMTSSPSRPSPGRTGRAGPVRDVRHHGARLRGDRHRGGNIDG